MTLTFFAMFGTFFLVAQYFQLVLGYSPLKSGLLQLPMAMIMMVVAPRAPKLVARFGVNRVVSTGLLSTGVGLFVFSQMQTDSPLAFIYLSIVPLAFGMAMTMTPLTTLIMASVPLNRAGVGSAMNDTTRELGGALGVAILGSVVTSVYANDISSVASRIPDPSARAAVESGLPGATEFARRAPESLSQFAGEVLDASKHAFVDGMSLAALVGAAVVVLASVMAYRLLPRRTATEQFPPHPETGDPDLDVQVAASPVD